MVNTTGRERFSLPLFFEPNFDAVVAALPSVRREAARGGGGRVAGCTPLSPCAARRCFLLTLPAHALLQCLEPGEAPRFPPITAGQHILERYHATHAGYGKAAAEQAAAVGAG